MQPRVRCLTDELAGRQLPAARPLVRRQRRCSSPTAGTTRTWPASAKRHKANLPEDAFYHLFEMNVDGTGVRQLTRGRYDDFDARYLPNGEIVFLSTRKGAGLAVHARPAPRPRSTPTCPTATSAAAATTRGRCPSSRCTRWTPRAGTCGRSRPSRTSSGRRRWPPTAASSTPAGTTSTASTAISSASGRPTPTAPTRSWSTATTRSGRRCVFEAAADPRLAEAGLHGARPTTRSPAARWCSWTARGGPRARRPLTRLTPEVCFPETEGWPEHYYANPWPLSEEYYLVAWSDRPLPPHTRSSIDDRATRSTRMGIYLYDAFGNLELLYRDPDDLQRCIRSPCGRGQAGAAHARHGGLGRAAGGRDSCSRTCTRGWPGVARGAVKRLRIVGVPPKVQPHMNTPEPGRLGRRPGQVRAGHGAGRGRRLGLLPRALGRAGLLPGARRRRPGACRRCGR